MSSMQRATSLSLRPGFPSGLRVLLVEKDCGAADSAAGQLRQCNYDVTTCRSSSEAVAAIASACAPFDLLLADTHLLTKSLRDKAAQLPTIMMAGDPKTEEIMMGIKLGVAEVLQKPLCPLKLKNIWQHTVRHLMRRCSSSKTALAAVAESGAVGTPLRLSLESQDGSSAGQQPAAITCILSPAPSLPASMDPLVSASSSELALSVDQVLAPAASPCAPVSSTPTSGTAPACTLHHSPSGPLAPPTPAAAGRRIVKRRSADMARANSMSVDKPGDVLGAARQEGAHAPATLTTVTQGLPINSVEASTGGMGMPGWPPVPIGAPLGAALPGTTLPPGMAWGMPMNPAAVAPGITPPIFPAPATPPVSLCGAPGPWPLLPGAVPPLGMPSPLGMGPMGAPLPGAFGLPGQLPPLPLPMLMGACGASGGPGPMLPGMDFPGLPPCSPTCPLDPALMSTSSDKSVQDSLALSKAGGAQLQAGKPALMPRCESNAMLPSLEELIADSPTVDGNDMPDLELEGLNLGYLGLSRNDSLEDLMAHSVVAF